MKSGTRWFAAALAAIGCSGARRLPSGPSPEYERPPIAPWDAGKAEDPFASAEEQGQWVEQAAPEAAVMSVAGSIGGAGGAGVAGDAAPPATADAGAPDAGG